MQQITVEPVLGQKLGELAGQVVLCDEQGRASGFFSPLPDHPPLNELQLEPPPSISQTEELRKNRTGKPLAEVLERLGVR